MLDIREFIKRCFLFAGLTDDELDGLIESSTFYTEKYSRGQTVYSPSCQARRLGFVVSGECEIKQMTSDGTGVLLNTLKDGDSFGILSVLSEEQFPTDIIARRCSEVLYIPGEALEGMLNKSPKASMNLIKFLASKVAFLNGKIETVTQTSVEKKLGSYLLSRAKSLGKTELNLNLKKCAESIGVGRASVYRAIESLRFKGYIEAESRLIKIISYEKLEEFLN